MKIVKIFSLFLLVPVVAFGASRGDSVTRVGMNRTSQAGARMSASGGSKVTKTENVKNQKTVSEEIDVDVFEDDEAEDSYAETKTVEKNSKKTATKSEPADSGNCRDAYRECMDNFCLLDESQGERCACSDNIERAKSKINDVLKIQEEADKLFTEGVEREQLGAKARLVFADNTVASKKMSSANFMSWLAGGEDEEDGDVGEDVEIGDDLYQMAVKYCANELKACGGKADMEETLYSRMITQDCKNYDAYLKEQLANAKSNKRIAESAVRKARLEMLDTTNKYNRGECLLAYRSCIADKGGCGANFENCLDAALLQRRANSCENILDQCMSVRDYVVKDWAEESKSVLKDAAKYADANRRGTCMAKIQNCLEESCSTSTNSECLSNVNVAAGVCPIITECEQIIPGLQEEVNSKLKYLQTKFCENDVDKCLQDKCGVDYTKPECVGKRPYEIAALCPQDMFPSCRTATQFDVIVQSAMLQMDYQMYMGCVSYFGEQLGKVCGTDMACLPIVESVQALTSLPDADSKLSDLRSKVIADSDAAVEEFFKQFEQDKTVVECADSQSGADAKKLKGKNSLGTNVFNSAKFMAKMSAEQRNLRELDSKIAELTRKADVEEARKVCLNTYKAETPDKSKSNYMYIKSVSFEPSLRNCHVCRMQQVCEEGGEDKATSALKSAAGGLAGGASMGALAPGGMWTAIIGGVGGAAAAGFAGYQSGGKKEFCQEVESCEDINM